MYFESIICLSLLLIKYSVGGFTKSSLTFVIDDTGSMQDDIDQVKAGANLVFDTVLNTNASQIEDFLLVSFNDPDPGRLRIRTRDRDVYKNQLGSLIVGGGGDCPELSMSGIYLALKESLPGSYIYVFTDASAKDEKELESVQNLATRKGSQIVFLLTGVCKGDGTEFQPYYQLARATSGQVFHIHKDDVEKILDYVAETVRNPKTVLGVTELPPGYGHPVNVSVDPGIKDLVVSVSGTEPKISNITAPDGSKPKSEDVVDLPSVLVVKVPDAIPGTYTMDVGSKSNTSVVASAATEILFKHGFLAFEPASIDDTASLPILGEKSHLAIELITKKPAKLVTVQILDMDDNVKAEMPLKLINKKRKLYTTEKFTPPDSLFKIAVKGYDFEDKAPFRRVTSTGIEPQKPAYEKPENRPPKLNVRYNAIRVDYNSPVKLMCKVSSYPKSNTIWTDEDGNELTSHESVIALPYDYMYVLEIDKVTKSGAYKCKAKNALGEDEAVVNVEVITEKPIIDKTTSAIRAEKGEDAVISCRILKGNPPPEIFWFVQYENSQEVTSIDGSTENITISNVDVGQAGAYRCAAINEHGSDYHDISLIVEYPPIVKTGKTYVTSVEGKNTWLTCAVRGIPRPRVDWFLNDVQIFSDRRHHIYRDNSLRFKGSKGNMGRYTCVAHNLLGNANRTILVDYVQPVYIEPPLKSTYIQKLGDDLQLQCNAKGDPKPTTKWVFYSSEKNTTGKELRMSGTSGLLRLRHLQANQDGYYVCVASNRQSSANLTYHVKINAPPFIEPTVDKTFTAVLGDLMVALPCKAFGNPKPDVMWSKAGFNLPSGSEWYDITDDGSLIIKNVDNLSAGAYVCTAENFMGKDTDLVKLIVEPYPDAKRPDKTIVAEEDSSRRIECPIPHSPVDSLRWYKDGRIIEKGELILRRIQISDRGIYTCRVQSIGSALEAQTSSIEVVIGSKPKFASNLDEVTIIDFEYGSTAYLDCMAYGEPVPKVTWYLGDKQLDMNQMFVELTMSYQEKGNYTCVVSNDFGSITRTHQIISKDCFLNIEKDFPRNQPVMIDQYKEWPLADSVGGFLRLIYDEPLTLHCPGGFMITPAEQVRATCVSENKFNVNGKVYEYSDLSCREEVSFVVRKTKRRCKGIHTELAQVGFNAGSNFVEAYDVCIDNSNNLPVYAKHRLGRSLGDVKPKDTKWYSHDLLPLNLDAVYDCESQRDHVSSLLGRDFHNEDKCCFAKRQLVNTRDLPAGLAQKAAYSYLNVVPHWSTCNSKNWDELESRVRDLAMASLSDLVVWTGVSGDLKAENAFKTETPLILEDNSYQQQAVPKYLWKVVQYPYSNSSLAIVQLNMPDVTPEQAYRHMLCYDICRDVPWMTGHNWRNSDDGFTFCCSLDQFEDAFGYKGHFGRGNKEVFYGVYELSERYL